MEKNGLKRNLRGKNLLLLVLLSLLVVMLFFVSVVKTKF